MIEVDVQIPDGIHAEVIVGVVEHVCMKNGLTCGLKGTLVSYPDSVHWHFKQGRQIGIPEITWWESAHRLWFKFASGRTSEWMSESIPRLKEQIEKSFD